MQTETLRMTVDDATDRSDDAGIERLEIEVFSF
jgi:hypothetical protein